MYPKTQAPQVGTGALDKRIRSQCKSKCTIIFLSLLKTAFRVSLLLCPSRTISPCEALDGAPTKLVLEGLQLHLKGRGWGSPTTWLYCGSLIGNHVPVSSEEMASKALWLKCIGNLSGTHYPSLLSGTGNCMGSLHCAFSASWIEVSRWLLSMGEEATGHLGLLILGNTYTNGHHLQVTSVLCATNVTLLIWRAVMHLTAS